jgi:peptide deformylase
MLKRVINMILKLVHHTDDILKNKTNTFDFVQPPTDPIQLAKDLYETMVYNKGIGLAAPQIGLPYRAFALFAVPGIVCFNPRIVDTSKETIVLEEGCLSYPNLFVKVKRPRRIKVRYQEPNGEPQTRVLDGMTARCFMHELDHLEGIVHVNRANKIHLDRAMRKKKSLDRMVKNAEERGLV